MNIKNSVNVFCKQFIVSFVAKLTSIGICYGISLRAYGADRFQFSHYSCFIVTKCQGHQHHFLFHQIGRLLTDLLCGRSKALITCVRNDRELFCHLHQSKPLPILKEESTNVMRQRYFGEEACAIIWSLQRILNSELHQK